MEQELRKKAIQKYLNGEKPKSIYQSLNRSKDWFFKWLKRYQSGDQYWYPRSPGIVIRLCLYFGVQPVFIPIGEPWRNGFIEKFNDTYNKKFFRRQWFNSYAHLKQQSKSFQRFHNKHHHYSYLKGKTPLQVMAESNFTPDAIGPNTKIPQLDEVPDGNIILIRFIRSDCVLDIFGEKFKLSKDLVYSYVQAVIVTEIHRLQIYLGNELVDTLDYQLSTG